MEINLRPIQVGFLLSMLERKEKETDGYYSDIIRDLKEHIEREAYVEHKSPSNDY